jgi:hypothetical protein
MCAVMWGWVQQHRWLSLLALAIVVIGTAGGTAWALVFRTVSSPINLRDALRLYRKEAVSSLANSWHARLPRPGVYTYRSSGGESLSIMGAQRSFPARSSMIVTDNSCAHVTWAPFVQHTETTTVCPVPDGAYAIPSTITHETIGGSTTTSTLDCPATLYLLPSDSRAGTHWSARCTLSDPHETVTVTGLALGRTILMVGGRRVAAEHVRLTQHFEGAASGMSPTDYWVTSANGLIIRESEQVDVTQDGVHYRQNSDALLVSLSPAQ